jgi:hypothetical protein
VDSRIGQLHHAAAFFAFPRCRSQFFGNQCIRSIGIGDTKQGFSQVHEGEALGTLQWIVLKEGFNFAQPIPVVVDATDKPLGLMPYPPGAVSVPFQR